MTTLGSQQRLASEQFGETEQQRASRLGAEASMLAVAEVDLEQGRVIGNHDVDAWLDAWERGEDVPLPERPAALPKPRSSHRLAHAER